MAQAPRLSLYGLLYVGKQSERHANLGRAAGNALGIYAANAVTLAKSAQAAGQEFTLVTNNAEAVENALACQGLSGAISLREQKFSLEVPEGIAFQSAHYKLELLQIFGRGEFGEFPALIDLDAVLLRSIELPDAERLWAYDISAQMWREGRDAAASASLERLASVPFVRPRWFGGEFLAGPSRQFAELASEIEAIWPDYAASTDSYYHQGDEMVVSAALNRLEQRGHSIGDAGAASLVCRWWSRRTINPMPALGHALGCAVMHLPADKALLAQTAQGEFDAVEFAAAYRRYAAFRQMAERAKTIAERLLGRTPQLVPQLV